MSADELHSKVMLSSTPVLASDTLMLCWQAIIAFFKLLCSASLTFMTVLRLFHARLDGLRRLKTVFFALQVKDPSKAAHAADADLKELVESRGLEMKKEPFTEAKCSQERYDQVSLNALF